MFATFFIFFSPKLSYFRFAPRRGRFKEIVSSTAFWRGGLPVRFLPKV
jgi:hypothetical protein